MTDPMARPSVIELPATPSLVEKPPSPAIFATDDPRPIDAGEPPTIVEDTAPAPRNRRRAPMVALTGITILILGLLVFDAAEWIREQFDRGPLVGSLAIAVIAAGGLGIAYWLVAELRALAALKSVERAQALITAPKDRTVGKTDRLIGDIESALPALPSIHAGLAHYREQVQPHHSLEQRIDLLSRTVLVLIDRRAETLIRTTVAQAVVFTAISPTALIETLFFLARGLRLVRQIAELYGGRPGFVGTLYLMRRIVIGSGAVGTVDMIGNVLAQKLGGAILEKLSSEVAESVYAAQKMARLGIMTMRMCRPIPFAPEDAPSVSGLVAHILKS